MACLKPVKELRETRMTSHFEAAGRFVFRVNAVTKHSIYGTNTSWNLVNATCLSALSHGGKHLSHEHRRTRRSYLAICIGVSDHPQQSMAKCIALDPQ